MSYFYPQAAVVLQVLPEDFQLSSVVNLQKAKTFTITPRHVEVHRNDHKTADTFTMELDYRSFPFDPRTIRACGVTIHMQDMGSLETTTGALNTIVPSQDNIVFAGYVDEETVEFDDARRIVKFEGRDYTCLLIDQRYVNNNELSFGQPIDVSINAF